jgi:hypothetical protein
MITFAPLRTKRLDVRLQELSIANEIELCQHPVDSHERAMTAFCRFALEYANDASPRLADPRRWTVGERWLLMAQYNIAVHRGDYPVTDRSNISDYLDFSSDLPAALPSFELDGDLWRIHPLTGAAAELLELLEHDSPRKGRFYWMAGMMAAQLVRDTDLPTLPDPVDQEEEYVAWLTGRMDTFANMPSSLTTELYIHFREKSSQHKQFFDVWFDDQGLLALPGKGAGDMPPARFRTRSLVSELALSLSGKVD